MLPSTLISRWVPLRRPTEMLRVMDRIPPLHPRPSTPATPAEITPGPAKWPAVLVLRPVTVFGPRISITGSMLAAMDSPMSEVSVLLQTPEDTPKVEFTHEPFARNMSNVSDVLPVIPFPSREDGTKVPNTAHVAPHRLTEKLRELSAK